MSSIAAETTRPILQLLVPQLHRDRVAYAEDLQDLILALRADVQPEVLDLRHLLSLFLVQEVDRLAGDNPQHRTMRAPNGQPLTDEHLRIPTADRRDVDETVVVDELHDQADLVAMSGQHHPQGGSGVSRGDHVAVNVGPHLVGKRRGIVPNHLLDRALIPRRAGRCQDLLEKV